MTVAEIEYGMESDGWGEARRAAMRQYIETRFSVVYPDADTVKIWAGIVAGCERKGRSISQPVEPRDDLQALVVDAFRAVVSREPIPLAWLDGGDYVLPTPIRCRIAVAGDGERARLLAVVHGVHKGARGDFRTGGPGLPAGRHAAGAGAKTGLADFERAGCQRNRQTEGQKGRLHVYYFTPVGVL